ncbi:hypothetical protein ACFQY0_17175 [Haloferula chungangensis]|uniref:Uncharacterized protein n=1 Tax=Haloferula chungangensis TaxID=1048331 RepID=A0ABW2L943_9BACT
MNTITEKDNELARRMSCYRRLAQVDGAEDVKSLMESVSASLKERKICLVEADHSAQEMVPKTLSYLWQRPAHSGRKGMIASWVRWLSWSSWSSRGNGSLTLKN